MGSSRVLTREDTAADVEQSVVDLLNLVVVVRGTHVQCELCQEENDSHLDSCPVPLLDAWIQNQ